MGKESLREILSKHSWRQDEADNHTWTRPKREDEKIKLEPTRWVHIKPNIGAGGYIEIRWGTSSEDLETYLSEIGGK